MKFSFNIHWFSAVALAAAFVSCAQIDDSREDAVGYLCFPGVEVDVTVEDLAGTKSLDGFAAVWPGESEIDFVITGVTDPAYSKTFSGVDAWATTPIALPAGSYKVTASVNTNSFGKPYFTSNEVLVSIDALKQTTPSAMNFSVANAAVNVTVHSSLAGHFKPAADRDSWTSADDVTLVSNGVTWAAKYDSPCFVPAGQELTVTLDGVSSAGVPKSYSDNFTPSAKSSYNVICGQENNNLPTVTVSDAAGWAGRIYVSGEISGNISDANKNKLVYEVSLSKDNWATVATSSCVEGAYHVINGLADGTSYYVRARIGNLESAAVGPVAVNADLTSSPVTLSHTYTSGADNQILGKDVLTGSQAVLDLGFTGIIKEFADKGYLVVSSTLTKGSNTMRTSSAYSGTMSVATNPSTSAQWIYLPQGTDYNLTVSYNLSKGSENQVTTFIKENLVLAKPDYAVSLISYASYDKYAETNGNSKDIDVANSCNPEYIYVGAQWSISDDVLSNANYATTQSYTVNGETKNYNVTSNQKTYSNATLKTTSLLTNWKSYTLDSSVTFDGVQTTFAQRTHHITGLPFNAAPPTIAGGWFESRSHSGGSSNIYWGDNYADLRPVGQYEFPSMRERSIAINYDGFHIPNEIGISFISSYETAATSISKIKYSLSLGSIKLINGSFSGSSGTYKSTEDSNNSNLKISPSNKSIKAEAAYSQANANSYYVRVKTIEIYYK